MTINKPTLNERRRAKYEADPAYREDAQDRARKRYRKTVKKEIGSCLRSLEFYTKMIKHEDVVLLNGKVKNLPVMNLPSAALLLQKRYQTVWRWVNKGMIPEPVLRIYNKSEVVFHSDEVRILIEEIGALEQSFAYYCKNHVATKERIFKLFEDKRKQLKIGV